VMPAGPGVRIDTHIEAGDRVPSDYDNLIAKLMVHAHDRDAAIDRLRRALDETEIGGVQTTLPFHRAVAGSDAFRRAELSTGWVEANWDGAAARREAVRRALLAAGLASLDDAAGAVSGTGTGSGDGTGEAGSIHAGGGSPRDVQPRGNEWRRGGRGQGVDRWPS
jgi:acetyl/propionyl-CoA carboxylase alpha subunit